jgi:hypothetical protein
MPFEQPASNFTAQPQNSESLFADFWKSAVHGAVEAPVTALGQLVDSNFDWEPIKPCNTKTGSVDYFVQGIGGAVGLVTDFAALKGGVDQFGKTGLAADLHIAPVLRNPLGLTAVTGGLYGGILTPTDPKYGNQFETRLKNTALTAATFTAMEGLSTTLAPLTKSDSKIGSLAKTIGINAGAGIPIGMLNTQAQSLVFDHKLADLNQTAQAGVDWAVIGGALAVPGAIRTATTDRSQKETPDAAIINGGTAISGDRATDLPGMDGKPADKGMREFKIVTGEEELTAFRHQDKAGVMLKVREMTDSGAGIKRSMWVQHSENDLANQAQSADIIAMCHGEKLPTAIAQKRVLSGSGDLYMSPGSRPDRISFGDQAIPKPGVWAPIKLDRAVANPFLDELKQRRIPIDDRGLPNPEILDAKERYSWALPDDEALSLIKKSAPEGITEIMAGKGYWAHLLQQMGVDVTAYDREPPTEFRTHYHNAGTFTRVEEGNELVAAKHPEKAMMVSWPPYGADQARQGLQAYMDAGGQKLIYIGERSKGCTGNDRLYRLIKHNWQSIETVPLHLGGWLDIYARRPEPYKGPSIPPEGEASSQERMVAANDVVNSAQHRFNDVTTEYGATRGDLKDFAERLFSLDDGELARLGLTQDWYKSSAKVSFPDRSYLTYIQPQPGAMAREVYRYDFDDRGVAVTMETGQLQNRKWEGSMRIGSSLDLDVDLRVELSGTNMTAPQRLEFEHQDNYQSFFRMPDGTLSPG